MAETLRTFAAIEIDRDVRERLAEAIRLMDSTCPGVKWVKPAAVHLTLAFLGDTDSSLVDPITEALESACRDFQPFSISVRGLGVFGGRRPRVVWCGIAEGVEKLRMLRDAIAGPLQELGFPPDSRPFHPHLTLGRIRRPKPLPELERVMKEEGAGFDAGESRADRLTFFKSTLTPAGAVYEPLAAASLGGKS